MTTGIVHDDMFLLHDTGLYHPERKERLIAVGEGLRTYGHHDHLVHFKPRRATEEELRLIHPTSYIRTIQQTSGKPRTQLDADTIASAESYEVALHAVGSLLVLIDAVEAGEIQNGFGFVRPPGHHAEPDRSMGFCLFSNVAIGAAYALEKYRLSRILVIDFDVHHGNGTQNAFYNRSDVLYVSTHQFPFYPGTGNFPEIGEKEGVGFTINFPLPAHSSDDTYNLVFDKIIAPIGKSYRPDLILVSAGYDAYVEDPLAGMEVTPAGFAGITQTILSLAQDVCDGKVVFLLEGGYHLKGLQTSVLKTLDELTGHGSPPRSWRPSELFEVIQAKSKANFGSYWKVF